MRACGGGDVRSTAAKESIVRFIVSLLLSALVCAAPAYAEERPLAPETPRSSHCPATPAVGAIVYPGAAKIPHTNDLVKPTGKPDEAEGQTVYLMGKVLDTECNPLSDVVVELWQPDPFSRFIIPTDSDMASPVAMFAGAGKAYTGIDGTFSFRTLFPGTLHICEKRDKNGKCIQSLERAPFFNIRISGKAIRSSSVSMALFFENDRRNPTDPVYKTLSDAGKQQLTMKVLPGDGGGYAAGMRTYLELIVPTNAHFHGY